MQEKHRAQSTGCRGRSAGLRAQGTGLRAQRKKHRAQGTGHRVKDLEMKGPHDCKAARPHDNVSCIIGDVL